MAFSAGFLRDQINRIIDQGLEDYAETVQELMAEAYDHIVNSSPLWSGYYKSNHSIVIRNSKGQLKAGNVHLSPRNKDTNQRFFYEPNVGARASNELDKLDRYEVGDRIAIVTIVPYADAVEAKHHVYQEAAAAYGLSFED